MWYAIGMSAKVYPRVRRSQRRAYSTHCEHAREHPCHVSIHGPCMYAWPACARVQHLPLGACENPVVVVAPGPLGPGRVPRVVVARVRLDSRVGPEDRTFRALAIQDTWPCNRGHAAWANRTRGLVRWDGQKVQGETRSLTDNEYRRAHRFCRQPARSGCRVDGSRASSLVMAMESARKRVLRLSMARAVRWPGSSQRARFPLRAVFVSYVYPDFC